MNTAIAPVETTVSVVVTADLPAELTYTRGGEYVLFRFGGEGHHLVDLSVPYQLLGRLGELVARAKQVYEMDEPPPAHGPELI